MLDKKEKENLIKEERADKTLTLLNGISEYLDGKKMDTLISELKNLVKAVKSAEIPDTSGPLLERLVSKFGEVQDLIRTNDSDNQKIIMGALYDMVQDTKSFHSKMIESYQKLAGTDFSAFEKSVSMLIQEISTMKDAEHEMDIEYDNRGNITKVKVKRLK